MARALLGEPNAAASNKRTMRWGAKGSMSVEVAGSKKGFWFSHEGGEGSDLLGLIRHVKGWRFPDVIEWASRHTGIVPADNDDWVPPAARQGPAQAEIDAARAAEAAEAEADEASRVAIASKIAAGCIPLVGTLGEIYLKQTRGIPAPAAGWSASIQYHPVHRALVAIATAPDGTVRAVQRVHLGENAGKVGEDERAARRLPAIKVTNGVTIGAVVRLPGDATGPLLIAEGPETGLSVHTATGHETWLSLGSVSKVQPPIGRKVIIVSDDNPDARDARYGQAAKALRKALQVWRKAGVDLVVATPWLVRRKDRSDFADVILQHGIGAVRGRVEAALQPARVEVHRSSLAAARKLVSDVVGSFFDRVDAGSADLMVRAAVEDDAAPPYPFTQGVRVEVGVGKSHSARERIAETLINMRARGDGRAIVMALPMHALSDEQAERFRELQSVKEAGLRVEVWRGRGAPDPAHPDHQHPDQATAKAATMCQKLEMVQEAQSVGLSAQSACCKRRLEVDGERVTLKCPLFDTCSYQAQARRSADLWIMASDLLWHKKPSAMGEIAAVVVDEGAWRKGLQGAEGRHLSLSLDDIGDDVKIPFGLMSEPRLRDLRRQLLEALRQMPDGPIEREALENGTQLTADSASEALKLEWSRKVDNLHPGLNKEERRAALKAAEANKTIPRFAMLWGGIRALLNFNGPEASGWVALDREQTKNGAMRVVHLKGRKDIASDWKVPTLLLDALLPVDLVRPFWPDIELVADVKAVAKHQHVRQVVDKAFALSMLAPLDEEAATADPEEAQRRSNRLHDLRAILIRQARRYAPGRVLIVLQKRVKEALTDLGSLPPNVELAHHNNVAGRDEWGPQPGRPGVCALIVVGRTQPPPSAIKRIAEALTGQAASKLADWYERCDAVREMADGSAMQAEAERHPDSLAENIRWQTCEGELVQIIGRARGVNRTAADPVDVLVLTDVALPIPLAGVLNAVELTPGPFDHMIASGGVVFGNPADAVLAYPFLWSNREAAKKAFQRGKLGTFPYRESYIGECPQLRRIDYKAAGQGKQAAVAGFDPVLCPNPEGLLRECLGNLAWCRVEGIDPPEPEPPVKSKRKTKPESDGVAETGLADGDDRQGKMSQLETPSLRDEAEPLVCDVPWLHRDAPAFRADDGAVILPACPYCGGRHRHRGFGHRLAHCNRQLGRGYVLRQVGSVVSGIARQSDANGSGGSWSLGP